ncbi:hypothetical protein [Paracoccus sp. ME4]|uniref:hypothetical protein n=1 Tax=Paracoccus sp. ME4 TaxID=3138066 RepID=UPI00398B7B35
MAENDDLPRRIKRLEDTAQTLTSAFGMLLSVVGAAAVRDDPIARERITNVIDTLASSPDTDRVTRLAFESFIETFSQLSEEGLDGASAS